MKITQITPGILPIPPNGWGAVEKIIWEYNHNLNLLRCDCQIKYLNEIINNGRIHHIHMANLAIEAFNRNLPYFFTMHDHHVMWYGKASSVYKQNLEAITKSVCSFVPSKFLLEYFDNPPNLYYLPHGVNTDRFYPKSKSIVTHRLLCVGNNGIGGDASFDRKGFVYAVESARSLNMPITIVGPKQNEKFFESNNEFRPYDKLDIVYDATEDELCNLYWAHSIFLHPSILEAGHPNLTLMEAMACGLPVASCYEDTALPGMVKITRNKTSIINAIRYTMENYDKLRNDAVSYTKQNDWSHICKTLLQFYKSPCDMRQLLIRSYNNTTRSNIKSINKQNEIIISFINGPKVEIKGEQSDTYLVKFFNGDKLEYQNTISNNMWVAQSTTYFIKWRIEIQSLFFNKVYTFNCENKRVYIAFDSKSLGDTIAWFPYVEEFRKKHGCQMITSTFHNELFVKSYPNIEFVVPGTIVNNLYAMYNLGIFVDANNCSELNKNVMEHQKTPLQQIASDILGLQYIEIKPKIDIATSLCDEKFVCIATESTMQCKLWNNLSGWKDVVNYLSANNYVIYNLSPNPIKLEHVVNVKHPMNLQEQIQYLNKCEFFIGLSSGLSWLAWAMNKKVVLISGFTMPYCEFYTPYRIINKSVCHGCFNNMDYNFNKSWNWCPSHGGTMREFECSKLITSKDVIHTINNIK